VRLGPRACRPCIHARALTCAQARMRTPIDVVTRLSQRTPARTHARASTHTHTLTHAHPRARTRAHAHTRASTRTHAQRIRPSEPRSARLPARLRPAGSSRARATDPRARVAPGSHARVVRRRRPVRAAAPRGPAAARRGAVLRRACVDARARGAHVHRVRPVLQSACDRVRVHVGPAGRPPRAQTLP
jgi:hypothetical protein